MKTQGLCMIIKQTISIKFHKTSVMSVSFGNEIKKDT